MRTIVRGEMTTGGKAQGLTRAQIDEVERDQGSPLPAPYRQFLAQVGGGVGGFLRGSDVFYPHMLGLGQEARRLLEENSVPFAWSPDDRVIMMHQGYQFDMLRGTGEDSEVWSYSEGTDVDVPVRTFDCFADWLAAWVECYSLDVWT